jgi:serine/threonine protein kinase
LGAVGYFLLSGNTPFSGRGMQQILTSLVQEPTPLRDLRPDAPEDLEAVIHRCLRRDPEERFADILLVDKALAACVCAASWSSREAAAWWQAADNPIMAGTECPHGVTPGS